MVNKYWIQREHQNAKLVKQRLRNKNAEIGRLLEQTRREIEKEINDFYQRYADKERITMAEAKHRADKMDVQAFSEKAKRYVKNRDFSSKANRELKLYNLKMKISRLHLLQNGIELELAKLYDEIGRKMDRIFSEELSLEYHRQAGILGVDFNKVNAEALLYSTHDGTTFADIWGNHIDILAEKLNQLLRQALIAGKNPTKSIGEIRKAFDVTHYQAKRLLITETTNLQTKVQADCIQKAGYSLFEFVAEANACDTCAAITALGPQQLEKLQKGINAPPIHPNCKCSIVPAVVKS